MEIRTPSEACLADLGLTTVALDPQNPISRSIALGEVQWRSWFRSRLHPLGSEHGTYSRGEHIGLRARRAPGDGVSPSLSRRVS